MSVSKSASFISSDSNPFKKEADKGRNQKILPDYYKVILPKTDIPYDSVQLNGEAERIAKLYCGPKRISRINAYKNDHPEQSKNVKNKTTVHIIKHNKLKNTKIMTISVAIFGSLGSLGWLAGPVGGIPGTTLGVAGGLALGGYFIKKRIERKIRLEISFSNHFYAWRADAIVNRVYPIFKNFIDADEEFQEFICPISQDICSVPMKAPDGQTYDKEFIEEYISSLGAGDDELIESPIRNGKFCKNDLVLNVQYCQDIIKKSQDAYDRIVVIGNANVAAYGLEAVKKTTQEVMDSIMKQVEYQVWCDCKSDVENGSITSAQRDAIVARTVAQWDWKIN